MTLLVLTQPDVFQLNVKFTMSKLSLILLKVGEVSSNTTVVKLNILCYNGATCFDCTESSSGPRVLDLYKECTTHCGIPNAYNNK